MSYKRDLGSTINLAPRSSPFFPAFVFFSPLQAIFLPSPLPLFLRSLCLTTWRRVGEDPGSKKYSMRSRGEKRVNNVARLLKQAGATVLVLNGKA